MYHASSNDACCWYDNVLILNRVGQRPLRTGALHTVLARRRAVRERKRGRHAQALAEHHRQNVRPVEVRGRQRGRVTNDAAFFELAFFFIIINFIIYIYLPSLLNWSLYSEAVVCHLAIWMCIYVFCRSLFLFARSLFSSSSSSCCCFRCC